MAPVGSGQFADQHAAAGQVSIAVVVVDTADWWSVLLVGPGRGAGRADMPCTAVLHTGCGQVMRPQLRCTHCQLAVRAANSAHANGLACSRSIGLSPCARVPGASGGASADVACVERAGGRLCPTVCCSDARRARHLGLSLAPAAVRRCWLGHFARRYYCLAGSLARFAQGAGRAAGWGRANVILARCPTHDSTPFGCWVAGDEAGDGARVSGHG